LDVEPIFKRAFGAHGVVASSEGVLLFPTGPDGILVVAPVKSSGEYRGSTFQRAESPFCAYQLIRLGLSDQKKEVFVCAARKQGIIVFAYNHHDPDYLASSHVFPGKDIVCVSLSNDPAFPLGIVALSLNGDVLFLPNVLMQSQPMSVHFPELRGTPYSLCTAQGALFLLTSHELAIISDGLVQLTTPSARQRQQPAWIIPVQATDMSCDGSDLLFLVVKGIVDEFRVSDLLGRKTIKQGLKASRWRNSQKEQRTVSELFEEPEWQNTRTGMVLAEIT
jgi:hypothetical protein